MFTKLTVVKIKHWQHWLQVPVLRCTSNKLSVLYPHVVSVPSTLVDGIKGDKVIVVDMRTGTNCENLGIVISLDLVYDETDNRLLL